MADMTMGQRIGSRRKLLGLSQEALGEKLGVSRQAISKWESDGAVPEIDKLIAMSKLFSVSVDWLLGTGEEPGGREDAVLSEKQLEMVEQIVRRYQTPETPPRKHLVLLACCAILVGVVLLVSYMVQTRARVDDLTWQLSQLRSESLGLRSELGAVYDRVDQLAAAAESQDEVLESYFFEISALEDSDKGRISFYGVPKSWQKEDTVNISVRLDGRTITTVTCVWDSTAYSAQFTLPRENGYEIYYLIIHDDGTQEQHRLSCPEVEDLARQMGISCSAGDGSYGVNVRDGILTIGHCAVSVFMPDSLANAALSTVTWTRCEFALYKNGQEVDRVSPPGLLTEGDDSTQFHASIEEMELSFGSLEEGENLELWLETELSNGLTGRAYVSGWMMQYGEIIGYEVVDAD